MILKLLGKAAGPAGCMIYAMPGVVEFLEQLTDPEDIDATDALLEWVTKQGPPMNRHKCWKLGDGIFELKHHPELRWTIVITHGFAKQGQRTPTREIKQAKHQRALFDAALKKENVKYDDMA